MVGSVGSKVVDGLRAVRNGTVDFKNNSKNAIEQAVGSIYHRFCKRSDAPITQPVQLSASMKRGAQGPNQKIPFDTFDALVNKPSPPTNVEDEITSANEADEATPSYDEVMKSRSRSVSSNSQLERTKYREVDGAASTKHRSQREIALEKIKQRKEEAERAKRPLDSGDRLRGSRSLEVGEDKKETIAWFGVSEERLFDEKEPPNDVANKTSEELRLDLGSTFDSVSESDSDSDDDNDDLNGQVGRTYAGIYPDGFKFDENENLLRGYQGNK